MQEWQLKELALRKQENAWYEKLSTFMKLIDNHYTFFAILVVANVIAFGVGLGIGLLL